MEKIDMDYKQRNEFKNLGWISVKPFNRDVAPLTKREKRGILKAAQKKLQ